MVHTPRAHLDMLCHMHICVPCRRWSYAHFYETRSIERRYNVYVTPQITRNHTHTHARIRADSTHDDHTCNGIMLGPHAGWRGRHRQLRAVDQRNIYTAQLFWLWLRCLFTLHKQIRVHLLSICMPNFTHQCWARQRHTVCAFSSRTGKTRCV